MIQGVSWEVVTQEVTQRVIQGQEVTQEVTWR